MHIDSTGNFSSVILRCFYYEDTVRYWYCIPCGMRAARHRKDPRVSKQVNVDLYSADSLGLGLGLGPLGWRTGVIVCCLLAYVASALVWFQYGWVSRNTSPAASAPNK